MPDPTHDHSNAGVTLTNAFYEPLQRDLGRRKPYVFISHVHEDKTLADEFESLLQRSSSGGVTAFNSSSLRDGSGPEYGDIWFDAIHKALERATHVVALVTSHSVGRPWIMYELGISRGKDRSVPTFALALGISEIDAFKGPLAQLQNCNGDQAGVEKLLRQIVGAHPDLDPEHCEIPRKVSAFLSQVKDFVPASTPDGPDPHPPDPTIMRGFGRLESQIHDLAGSVSRLAVTPRRRVSSRSQSQSFPDLGDPEIPRFVCSDRALVAKLEIALGDLADVITERVDSDGEYTFRLEFEPGDSDEVGRILRRELGWATSTKTPKTNKS